MKIGKKRSKYFALLLDEEVLKYSLKPLILVCFMCIWIYLAAIVVLDIESRLICFNWFLIKIKWEDANFSSSSLSFAIKIWFKPKKKNMHSKWPCIVSYTIVDKSIVNIFIFTLMPKQSFCHDIFNFSNL